ncbi:MAG: molybdopterin molybdotransferase MoeA [Planctomycetales bacterium]|nr:molybdopterin molybdotransferase MoeA [Planctomycetales bacterium]
MNLRNLNSPNADVRMKGFLTRTTVDDAWAWIGSTLPAGSRNSIEVISLKDAAGRILAEDIISEVNVPGFNRSMMDGYALRAEETYGATSYNALAFNIIGTSLPGQPFTGIVTLGSAVRIMTGAPMPDGATAVLPVEGTEIQNDMMLAMSEVSIGKHVGVIGEDVAVGARILTAGRTLRPQDLGVLSSIGRGTIPVIKRPLVRILITGNELLPAGTSPEGFQIADANGPMLYSLVNRDGGIADMPPLIHDNRDQLQAAMLEPADVILVSGGSSVGEEDHAPQILAQHGTLAIHGIAMRPGSPAGMGILNGAFVFLLPGNPVSCLCAYDFFAGRVIRALGGRNENWPYRRITATLTRRIVSTVGRVDYARVKLDGTAAEPIAVSGASVLSSTTQADGFMIIPANSEGFAANSTVDVFCYD